MGPGVVTAFNAGLTYLGDTPFDVIAKLDCDLEFGPDCFSRILEHFQDPRVGMASGTTLLSVAGKLVSERYAPYHVPGQRQVLPAGVLQGPRRAAAGLRLGCHRRNRRPPPRLAHPQRPRDRLHSPPHARLRLGDHPGRIIWGRCAYAIGSHPLFALARGSSGWPERPWLVGGLIFLWGFFYQLL